MKTQTDIQFEDVAKLRRDTLLTKATKAILIYPQINFGERSVSLDVMNEQFRFELDVININEEQV